MCRPHGREPENQTQPARYLAIAASLPRAIIPAVELWKQCGAATPEQHSTRKIRCCILGFHCWTLSNCPAYQATACLSG